MYRHIAFKEVSANFANHFDLSISPYYDRIGSNKSGMLKFLAHKFVKHLINNVGYKGSAHESLEHFICQKYSQSAWNFLKRLM